VGSVGDGSGDDILGDSRASEQDLADDKSEGASPTSPREPRED